MRILASRNAIVSASAADDENVRLTEIRPIRKREPAAMAVPVDSELSGMVSFLQALLEFRLPIEHDSL